MVKKGNAIDQRIKSRSLHYRATMLRAHIVACKVCAGAINHNDGTILCPKGVIMACSMAQAWDVMIEQKKSAGPDDRGRVYACPDPALHGEGYHMCAEMYQVVAIQEGLF